eukprot:CAMPEP_0194292978 /NCGR_PEP_ID=MMETSP0169-20130528/46865_1 /TAXON_ID=218684 /ORGANISM="Corethron pennatum, Strain L29A3" /LENGTH=197 /DNA_ID=CAMNT_0039041325 /DNA_START=83 /DNA_END=673 /DNA_ORIENTATION=+
MISLALSAMQLITITLLIPSGFAWNFSRRLPQRSHRYRSLSSLAAANGDPVASIPLMEAELAALDSLGEDATEVRSELEGRLDDAKNAAEFGVRRAQAEFYSAFSSGDQKAMENVWSTGGGRVRCVHPGMSSIEGTEAVMASWAQILKGGSGGFEIAPARTQIEISGRVAMCSCIEETPGGGKLEALNIYTRENGNW